MGRDALDDAKNALRRPTLKELISALDVDVANLSDDHRKSFTYACDMILRKIKTQLDTLELCQSTRVIFRKVASFITMPIWMPIRNSGITLRRMLKLLRTH